MEGERGGREGGDGFLRWVMGVGRYTPEYMIEELRRTAKRKNEGEGGNEGVGV